MIDDSQSDDLPKPSIGSMQRAINSLYRMLIALLITKLNCKPSLIVDPEDRKPRNTPLTGIIVAVVERAGLKISHDTVVKHLRAACNLYHDEHR